jgi:tripartite-type tricarboxylate transporter receptor subunit TctC
MSRKHTLAFNRRRRGITLAMASWPLLASVQSASAQSWPTKPVRLIVPSPPGDGSDLMARSIGQKLAEALGQQVVVDNRPGAGGRLGTELAVKAPPDGYTLLMGNAGSNAINAALFKDLAYDLERDFVPITQVMRAPNVLVINPALPVGSVGDLIALYKANPGKYSYGSGGNGSSAHLSAELFKTMAGVDVVHVPYKGATPALTDVIAGQVAMFIGNLPPAMGHIKSGRVKALAVTTAQRSALVPDVPTMAESGLAGYETVAWFGLFAPAGAPGDIVARLAAETAKIVQQPAIREQIASLGGEPVGNAPAEFSTIVRSDIAKWKRVVADAKVKVD